MVPGIFDEKNKFIIPLHSYTFGLDIFVGSLIKHRKEIIFVKLIRIMNNNFEPVSTMHFLFIPFVSRITEVRLVIVISIIKPGFVAVATQESTK